MPPALRSRFAPIADGQSAYYLPGRWVPHCTLVDGLPNGLVPEAIRIALALDLSLTSRFAGFRIVDIPAGRIARAIPHPTA